MSGVQPQPNPGTSKHPQAAKDIPHSPGSLTGPSAQNAVITDLHDRVVVLSEERGRLRAQVVPDVEALRRIDTELKTAIVGALELAPNAWTEYAQISSEAKEAHDEARLQVFESLLRQSALRCGLAQGRQCDEKSVAAELSFISSYRASQGDLFARFPDLSTGVDKLLAVEENRGIQMRLDADKIAMTISIAIRRVIPDAQTVVDALTGKTAHELQLIKEAFQSRYHLDLSTFITRGFDRPGLKYLMKRDAIVARALDLLDGKKCTADGVCTLHAARSLRTLIDKLFPKPAELWRLEQSLSLDDKALIIGHCLEAGGKKNHRVYEVLERVGRENFPALRSAYAKLYSGRSIESAVGQMQPGYAKDRTVAFLNNETASHNAAVVGCCLERTGKRTLITLFEEYHLEGRLRLVRDFQAIYQKDFWARVEEKHRKSDISYLKALAKNEEVPKAEMLWHCMDGPGTDEHGIRRALNGMTRAQVQQLETDYFELSRGRTWFGKPEKLADRLRSETSGDAWHDIQRLLEGVPDTAQSLHDRLLSWHRHERSGPWIRRVDGFTREGEVMDRDVGAAHEYYEANIRDKAPSPEVIRRFQTMVRFCNRDMVGFRMTKNDWSDFAANTTSAAVAVAFVYPLAKLTGGIPHPALHAAVVALGAGTIQGGVQFFLKMQLKGDGFGREEKIRDISLSALRAGSFYLSKFLPISVLRRPIDLGTKMGLKTIIRLGETSDVQRIPAHALTLKDLRRALDEDVHSALGTDADANLGDGLGCGTDVCSTFPQDVGFEQALRRLHPA